MGSAQSSVASPASKYSSTPRQSIKEKQSSVIDSSVHQLASLRLKQTATAALTEADVELWDKKYDSEPVRKVLGTLLSKQDILANLTNRRAEVADTQVFNLKLTSEVTPVTNQKSSGRCWLFATMNCARLTFAKKYNVDEFQFSQSYLFFWDKLEKANFYLENMIDLVEEPLDSRTVQYLSAMPENDGGQWDMAVNLVEKYGVCPQSLFPESYSSSNSGRLNSLLTSKLREYNLELREIYGRTKAVVMETTAKSSSEYARMAIQACRNRKVEQMSELYRIIAMCVGTPPKANETVEFEFYDKNKKFQTLKMSPLELYSSLATTFKAEDNISLINDPRNDMSTLYTVQRLGNVWGARPVLYVNTETKVMEEMVVKMLKADLPVWFGCDIGKLSNSAMGVMDCDLYDYANTFGTTLGMNKAQRLQTGESSMTHAMVIVAAHLDKTGTPVRYRIENSWSDAAGSKGYFVCTAEWFRQYVYQIVAPKKVAPSELTRLFEQGKAVELPPWDPMGSLA
ncbi:MAG: hypothetical protein CYPHOPRED_003901 [Cyphobasidiales sp. Tagirdzhanova-0007]|nr:MAG: hypothetical protein CYPHOPRED_003901 [Cyphobasidiales sp. Tagirdzhanova-0007]